MKQYLMILSGLLMLAAGPVLASEIIYYPPSVTGKKARRAARYLQYANNLQGDKKAVFEEFGFSKHRLRFNAYGQITERWRYPRHGIEFTFDSESNIIEKRAIKREDRRSWYYQ